MGDSLPPFWLDFLHYMEYRGCAFQWYLGLFAPNNTITNVLLQVFLQLRQPVQVMPHEYLIILFVLLGVVKFYWDCR